MMHNIIGIDPGESGGIAFINADNGIMETYPMPGTMTDVYDLIHALSLKGNCKAYLEDVGHGMPGQSSKATAVFARHNGHIEMALYALEVPTVKVTPQKWQKHYSNTVGNSSGLEKKEWKNKLKALAQTMHPTVRVTLKTADAILIAEYGKDKER